MSRRWPKLGDDNDFSTFPLPREVLTNWSHVNKERNNHESGILLSTQKSLWTLTRELRPELPVLNHPKEKRQKRMKVL
jgi:hypothetical protein